MALVHARALLADNARTIVVEGDALEPESILADPGLRAHLDFSQPVAVLFAAMLHFVTDAQDPARIVFAFADAMVSGSGLVISHVVAGGDGGQDAATRRGARIYAETTAEFVVRSRGQVRAWFEGFELVRPGLVDRAPARSAIAPVCPQGASGVSLIPAGRARACIPERPGNSDIPGTRRSPGLVEADRWRQSGNGGISAPIVAGVGLRAEPYR
jgi:hypothetical protein